jgi:hypothetical protein
MLCTSSIEGVSAENLDGFFVGWPNRPTPQTHLELLKNSDEIILAIDEHTGKVAGFITALTDRTLSAYIPWSEAVAAATRNEPPPSAVKRSGMEMGQRRTISRVRSALHSEFYCFIDWPVVV